jgi:hypothetical protein
MAKNQLHDLRDHLFLALEKIQNPEDGADIELEMRKAMTIAEVGKQIIETGKLEFQFLNKMDELDSNEFVKPKELAQ